MIHFDHGMLGATIAVAVGAQRRLGWPIVVFAALIAMFPDWDALPKHYSREVYVRGHRVWGHNVFAVAASGTLLGSLGYWMDRSLLSRRKSASLAYWIVLGMAIMATHPLMDFLYCGVHREADWPVGFFWPVQKERFGQPWIPWTDWGATGILAVGLVVIALTPRFRQLGACLSLATLALYVGLRGWLF